ncbi:hypothetical protein [Bradyrhizobium erythrophlei]|jgi:hypothetical protein|nr:hypothetical protein [Bradyrhizobium erythrophlei]
MSRIDGWVVDPENEDRIPPVIAEMIARAMPEPNEIEVIRAPMIAGQRVVEREHTYE